MAHPIPTSLLNAFLGFVLLASTLAQAEPTLITGTPADSYLALPTQPSPLLTPGTLINFDSLPPFTAFASGN